MGKQTYTDADILEASREASTMPEICKQLGIRGGGSRQILVRRMKELSIDLAKFKYKPAGRKREKVSFECQWCHKVVPLGKGERPRTYCSEDCLEKGRPLSLAKALGSSDVRKKISFAQKENWKSPEGRALRIAAAKRPEVKARKAAAAKLAAKSPELRAKRSVNATLKWYSDSDWRERFLSASKEARQKKVLVNTCQRKPHVPCLKKDGSILMVRSTWERDFILWLDRQNLPWDYEPVRVVVGGRPYTPDFRVHLPSGVVYVELHRNVNVLPNDTKLGKMIGAAPLLDAPLFLIGDAGIVKIKKQLRERVLPLNPWEGLLLKVGAS